MDHAKASPRDRELEETILKFFLRQKQAYGTWTWLFELQQIRKRIEPGREQDYPKEASPIYYACSAGLRHIAEILIDNGADVNAKGGEYGYPLVAASFEGRRDMVALLLDNGAHIDVSVDDHGMIDYGTALQTACFKGHKDIVELLLEKGADVEAGEAA
jgi:ankyrin repeat protein